MARPARRDRDDRIAAVTLRDGARVTLRQVVPEDKPLLVDVFNRLSERSRRQRFFTSIRELSPVTLTYFTEIDHSDREAIIALDEESDRAVGVARYVRVEGDRVTAEVAVAVADEWQHRGLAPVMLAELSSRAHSEGVERFVAIVQAQIDTHWRSRKASGSAACGAQARASNW